MKFAGMAALLASLVLGVLPAGADTADLFGRASGLEAPSLSPSGNLLAVECAPHGKPSICIFDIVSGGASRLIPIGKGYRLQGHYWANDDYLIINVSQFESLQLMKGQQEHDFQRAIAYSLETGEATVLMRDEALLLDTQTVVSTLPEDPKRVLIASAVHNTAHNEWTLGAYEADLKSGKSRKAHGFSPNTVAVWYDVNGEPVADMIRSNKAYCVEVDKTACSGRGGTTMQLRHNRKPLIEFDGQGVSEFNVLGLDQTSGKLVVLNDIGEKDGLHFMSLETGEMEPVMVKGETVGRAPPIIDTYTRGIVGFHYFDGLTDQLFIDPALRGPHEQLQAALADKRVSLLSWNQAKTKIVVSAESAGRPADFYVFDTATGQLGPVGSLASHLASEPLGEVAVQTVTMRDGLEIEAILTLPAGKSMEDAPFPVVLLPHGGPEARDGLGFDWWTQAYARDGYLVVQPNFRGSDGYGQAFRNAGFGEFGGKMIDDIVDTGAWAVEAGLAEGGQYCVAGASYGGYAALMMALNDQPRTACVISINGVSDPFRLIGQYEIHSEPHEYWERYIGSNRFSSEGERAEVSPLLRAGEMGVPVMLLHGEEDLVVPTSQSLQMAAALEGRAGLEAASLGPEDHYMRTSHVRHAVLEKTLAFLKKHHPAR